MAIGILIMVALALAFVVFFNFAQRKLLKEKSRQQELQLQHQKELLHSTILTQERERKRIAKDLHDEIGSKLNVIHLNMHRLNRMGNPTQAFKDTIDEVNTLIHTTIGTTRRISHDLLPPTLEDFGFVEAVKELCESYQSSGEVELVFNWEDKGGKLSDKDAELNLFRILQELIKNSIIHGKANRIDIDLSLLPQKISLQYQDNGVGFDMEKVQRKGLGLRNLESRVGMIGATMDFFSAPNEGVKVSIVRTQ